MAPSLRLTTDTRSEPGRCHRHRGRPGCGGVLLALAGGLGSSWLATVLWSIASQRLSASLCGQLIVSETLFALLYSFLWDGRWPHASELAAALLFVLGILASIKAHR
jgi:drug/metabolite transporter (DMT)-like permease